MVLPKKFFHEAPRKKNGKSGHAIIGLLRFAGMGVYVYDGELLDEFMVKIRGIKTLKVQADNFDDLLPLDPAALREFGLRDEFVFPFVFSPPLASACSCAHLYLFVCSLCFWLVCIAS